MLQCRPAVQLPGASKPVVAVRFCPVMFSCHPDIEQNLDKDSNGTGVFKLPYRLVFAVATLNSLFVYDTQSTHPIAVLAGIHYAAITDIAWSCEGKFLAVSSQDGFCTLVAFDQEELGSPLPPTELPSYIAKFLPPARDMSRRPEREVTSNGIIRMDQSKEPYVQVSSHTAKDEVVQQDHQGGTDKIENFQSSPKRPCGTDKIESFQSCPKRPRRITPVAMDVSCKELHAQVSLRTTKDKAGQQDHQAGPDKIENFQSSPKGPRRITPVAMEMSCKEPDMQVSLHTAKDEVGQQDHQTGPDKIENPKRPRRITPVAMDVSCTTQQIADASRDDRK